MSTHRHSRRYDLHTPHSRRLIMLVLLLAVAPLTAWAGNRVAPSGNIIHDDIISGGGAAVGTGAHVLWGAVGQPVVGRSLAASGMVNHGWPRLDKTPFTVTLAPTVSVDDPTNMTPIPLRIEFNKPVVNDFSADDILTDNATVDNFVRVSETEYTFDLLPFDQDVITAQVPEGAAIDPGGNPNEASNVFSRTFESDRPTVTLASTAPSATNTLPIPVTATFSVPVFGFVAGDVLVNNATVTNFSGFGANYTFDLVPIDEGHVTARVPEDAAVDSLGARNTASNTLTRVYDITPPTVLLSSGAPDPTNASIPVTATFDETVYGFTASDVQATNATVTNFTGAPTYTFTLVPTITQGQVSAFIPADVMTDAAGNSNMASNELIREYDSVAPTVSSVAVEDGLTVLVTFDKDMGAGVDVPANYIVSGSGLGTLDTHPADAQPESASAYRLTWNLPNEMFDGGDITITVSNVADYVGNAIGTPNSGTDVGGAIGEAPDAQCRDITVYLSEPILVPADIDDGSSDNVGIETMLINSAAELVFSCDDIATSPNEVTLTLLDAAGNEAACAAQVTVVDDVPPEITIPGPNPAYVAAGAPYEPPTASAQDNCDGAIEALLVDDGGLDTDAIDTYVLVYRAEDSAGNIAEAELTVIVQEAAPIEIVTVGDQHFVRLVGESVSFEIEASGGIGTLSYQWKRKGAEKMFTDIPGAQLPRYTIDPVAEEDAGEYLCEVSDGMTTEQSGIFTLAVGTGLPVASLFGLALAAALTATAGVLVKRSRTP